MDGPTMRERVASARVGRLGTLTGEGRPHLVPCCFVLEGERVYSAVDEVKPKATAALKRLANVQSNPVASLLVDHYEEDWSRLWWVRVDGHASVVGDERERGRASSFLATKYEQYREALPSGPVIAIDIETWRSWP
jgi:PPOX class probable F420-dependent enzyme